MECSLSQAQRIQGDHKFQVSQVSYLKCPHPMTQHSTPSQLGSLPYKAELLALRIQILYCFALRDPSSDPNISVFFSLALRDEFLYI